MPSRWASGAREGDSAAASRWSSALISPVALAQPSEDRGPGSRVWGAALDQRLTGKGNDRVSSIAANRPGAR